MRIFLAAMVLLLGTCAASAQEAPAQPAPAEQAPAQKASAPQTDSPETPAQEFARGKWELSAFGGGGTGAGKSFNTQFLWAGGRVGRVLTGEHGPGWLRGDFEWAVDMLPVFEVFAVNQQNIYGGSFVPAIWQWNFTSGKRIVPYFAAQGGILFTKEDVPPGDTSPVNFTSGAKIGIHYLTKRHQALLMEMSVLHISNASLGRHNPGYNGSLIFSIGYSWLK